MPVKVRACSASLMDTSISGAPPPAIRALMVKKKKQVMNYITTLSSQQSFYWQPGITIEAGRARQPIKVLHLLILFFCFVSVDLFIF